MLAELTRVLGLALLVLMVTVPAAASVEEDFNRGVDFFKAGEYSAAVAQFESARQQGLDTVALHFNLASCYYKLGDYPAAERFYRRVAEFEKMQQLAEYNLGLIALKQGNNTQARKYFLSVIQHDNNTKLATLARSQLKKTGPQEDRIDLFLSFNTGYDDNITASPDDSVSGLSDSFYDMYLSANFLLAGQRKYGWTADASYYRIDFNDSDTNDEYQSALGLTRTLQLADWSTDLSLNASRNNFAGDDYQSATKLDIRGKKILTAQGRLYLRYRYEDINSELAVYDYLEGWRQRARLEYRNYARTSFKQLYYEIEVNDRQQLVTSSYAYDYSPTRHTLRTRYTYMPGSDWRFSGELSYRYSDFPSSDSFDRDDELWKAALSADFRFNKSVKLTSKIQFSDNASTVDRYRYDKSTIRVGINTFF